ncbi:MAG TPA: hypothetical protein VJ937_14160 [Salinivirga sp.]|uniref:hypothetical protein n=1 Tax=Salinivirga sp. TaxID=1970192 RepID=UPI002B49CFDB|nr:hypothetical protein [Salinivirga sp.]HKK60620.1 hypothetical protein [Salinivirga sp.]
MKRTLLITTLIMIVSTFAFYSCGNPEYDKAIEKADAAMEKKAYKSAKTYYSKALKIMPKEEYPQKQLKKVNKILEEIARKKAIEDEKNYKAFIEKADKLYGKEQYAKAREQYQKALNLMPNEKHPKQRIAEIDKMMAEAEAMKNYPYHIVVGAFEVDKNAVNYLDRIQQNYSKQARSLPIGRLDAITYKSYKSLNEAYNDLNKARQITPNAWVWKK